MPTQPVAAPGAPAGAGIVAAVLYLIFLAGVISAYVIVLIAVWRAMKAHEKIAVNLKDIADKLPLK